MIEAQDILTIIRENDIKVDVEKIDLSMSLREQGLDSLDMTSILFSIEEKFDKQISNEDINREKLLSVDSIVSFINKMSKCLIYCTRLDIKR